MTEKAIGGACSWDEPFNPETHNEAESRSIAVGGSGVRIIVRLPVGVQADRAEDVYARMYSALCDIGAAVKAAERDE